MPNNQYFVEERKDGTFAVRRGGSQRASVVTQRQREGIDWTQERGHNPIVERVRQTSVGKPDQWRKP